MSKLKKYYRCEGCLRLLKKDEECDCWNDENYHYDDNWWQDHIF